MIRNIFTVIVICKAACFAFNIDTSMPIIKESKNSGKTYFGYSVFPHELKDAKEFSVLVGAPLDNMSNYMVSQHPSGAVYSCPITKTKQDCRAILMLKLRANFQNYNIYKHQWMGVHVHSDTVDKGGQYAYTCAHRFMTRNKYSQKRSVPGQCLAMPNSLSSSPMHKLLPLNPDTCPLSSSQKSMCLRGTGFASRPDLGVLAVGAANEEIGAGVVHYSRLRPEPGRDKWNRTAEGSEYAYSGTSVALGRIYKAERVNFTLVSGAPGVLSKERSSGRGEVRLYAVKEEKRTRLKTVLIGERFGSRFGQTLLSVDINGDGWDDLIVGAPDHIDFENDKTSTRVVGTGAAYVYINEEGSARHQRSLRRVLTLRPRTVPGTCAGCQEVQFGASLGRLGDLNMDGLEDVAIGAPGEGDGVVYVFHGDRITGLTQKPTQVLEAKAIDPRLRGFGTSVAGGMDLDGNRYPDVVVGAPFSGHAVILRTRPVIDVISSVVFNPAELQASLQPSANLVECGKDGRCLEAKIYLSYRHAGDKSVVDDAKLSLKAVFPGRVTLELDGGREGSRIVFENGGARVLSRKVQLRHVKVMEKKPAFKERLYIDPHAFMDKMNPITLRLSWKLELQPPTGTGLPNLNQFPVYDAQAAAKTFKLPWTKTCAQPVCVSDLRIDMSTDLRRSSGNYVFYFGREDDFWLNFTLSNSREPAHRSVLNLDFTNRLSRIKTICPYHCKMEDSRLRCPIANPLSKGVKKTCSIHMSGSNIVPDTPRLDFVVSLETVSDNVRSASANFSFSAEVQILADIRMTSLVDPEMIIYGDHRLLGASSVKHEKKVGPAVSFTLQLENLARSGVVPASHLVIYWPYELLGEETERHGKYLLYMIRPPLLEATSNRSLRCDASTWTDIVNPNHVRLLSRDITISEKEKSLMYSSNAENTKGYEICSNGLARCRPIRCQLGHLSYKTGRIRIRIEARLWVHTMTEDFPESRFVPLLVNVSWFPATRYKVAQLGGNGTSILMRLLASNTLPQPPRRPDNLWMVMALSGVGGVLILGAIVLLLWKIDFFRRDRRVQEQRLAQRQQAEAEEEERHKYDYMEYD